MNDKQYSITVTSAPHPLNDAEIEWCSATS
jgi:hypothetical protein